MNWTREEAGYHAYWEGSQMRAQVFRARLESADRDRIWVWVATLKRPARETWTGWANTLGQVKRDVERALLEDPDE